MRKQVLFIAIFAILLTGCNNQQQAQPDDQNMTGKENVTPVVEETATTADTISEEIVPEYDLNSDLMKADEIKNKETKEVADCEDLVDESLKSRCINDVLLFQALEGYDKTICDQMTTDSAKNGCKARVEEALKYRNS